MCSQNNPSLVFIVEPMVVYDSIPSWFWNKNMIAGALKPILLEFMQVLLIFYEDSYWQT